MMHLQHKDLLDAGVHFGHLTSKWHPHMAPFIFMKRNGIHIIDLNKTLLQLQEAARALKVLASTGKRILFVATKKQAKEVVEKEARRVGMPYVTERWLGGTLTNFVTIRKLIRKLVTLDKLMREPAYQNRVKKEQLVMAREKIKLERLLQGIADTTRLPAALIVVDIKREKIAIKEAKKLGITVFALTDTNSDPDQVDYPIPSNDDSSRSIELIIQTLGNAIKEGLEEREKNHQENKQEQEATTANQARKVIKVASSEEKISQPIRSKPVREATPQAAQPGTKRQAVSSEKTSKKEVTTQEGRAFEKLVNKPSTPRSATLKRSNTTTPKAEMTASSIDLLDTNQSKEKLEQPTADQAKSKVSKTKPVQSSAKLIAGDVAEQKALDKGKVISVTETSE